jgi:hypothetical protein
MATKAYFTIKVAEEFCTHGYQEIIRELKTLPEVKNVEPVRGRYNLLVEVEAPIRVIMVAHKILPMKWVERLNIMTVEPVQDDRPQRLQRETLQKIKDFWASRTAQPELEKAEVGLGRRFGK